MKTQGCNRIQVTGIIPYFNRASTIDRAVRSLEDIDLISEILIVDDEQSSASAEILRVVSLTYEKVKILPNLSIKGALSARIEGAIAAKNDLVIFLDSDDEVNSEGVLRCLDVLMNDSELSMAYGNISFGGDMQHFSDFIRVSGFGYLQVLKNLSLCPFSGLCIRLNKINWSSIRRDLPAWQDDEFVLTAARFEKIRFVDCITAIMHDSGAGRISNNKRSQLVGLRVLLQKWKSEIIRNFGITHYYIWKLREFSIFLGVVSESLEKKRRSSSSNIESTVIRYFSFIPRITQRLLRCVLGFFFDRIYA